MAERSLSMREVRGSIPCCSNPFAFFFAIFRARGPRDAVDHSAEFQRVRRARGGGGGRGTRARSVSGKKKRRRGRARDRLTLPGVARANASEDDARRAPR
eukprot:29902-Pelagococcus_subviridis.AAC.4